MVAEWSILGGLSTNNAYLTKYNTLLLDCRIYYATSNYFTIYISILIRLKVDFAISNFFVNQR